MRKIFIYCLIFLSVVVQAQIYTNNKFDSPLEGVGDQRGWTYLKENTRGSSFYGRFNYGDDKFQNCNQSDNTNRYYIFSLDKQDDYFEAVYTPTEIGNGEAITCSANFSQFSMFMSSNNKISFSYSLDGGTTWTILGKAELIYFYCRTKTEVIPAGIVTATNSGQFRFKIRITRPWDYDRANTEPIIDDLKLVQKALVAPSCPSLTTPANNARNVSVRPKFSWSVPPGAYDYKLSIGTTLGGTDALNNATVNHDYAPAANKLYSPNTKYYVKLIATNPMGDSKGCAETTFTTGDNPFAPYCGPVISSTPTLIGPITSVDIAGTAYTSDATATAVGAFEPHQSFVDKVFTIENNVTTVPITVKGIRTLGDAWLMTVFIDWNNDGNFDGAGEAYFNTYNSTVRRIKYGPGNLITLMADLPIPAGTPLGKKRMRVKFENTLWGSSLLTPGLINVCSDIFNGQVEDYTISYEKYLAVSDVDKKNTSIYPNPFRGVLQFSEVKDAKSITVADVSGKVVATPKVSQELNLSHLSKGAYFITVSYHNRPTKSFKVVKE